MFLSAWTMTAGIAVAQAPDLLPQSLPQSLAQPPARSTPGSFPKSVTPLRGEVTADDRALDCAGLKAVILDLVDQLQRARAAGLKESAALPVTLTAWAARVSGPLGAGIEALQNAVAGRARTEALARLHASKTCGRIDVAALLQPAAIAVPDRPDRCMVRTDSALEDCVEDIAQWRCRGFAGKGRAYLSCLDQVGRQVIGASGFQLGRLARFDPDCSDRAYGAASCSVFSNSRGRGTGTMWCKRIDASTLESCDIADGKSGAGKVGERINCRKVRCDLGTCNRLCAPPV
jgi:hypothetical protein